MSYHSRPGSARFLSRPGSASSLHRPSSARSVSRRSQLPVTPIRNEGLPSHLDDVDWYTRDKTKKVKPEAQPMNKNSEYLLIPRATFEHIKTEVQTERIVGWEAAAAIDAAALGSVDAMLEAQKTGPRGDPTLHKQVQYLDTDDDNVRELKEANQALRAELEELRAAANKHKDDHRSKLQQSKQEVAGMQRVILMWQVVSWMQASEELRSRRVLYALRVNSARERQAAKLLRAQQEIEGTQRVLLMWQVVSWMKSSEELRLRRVVVGWRLASARFYGTQGTMFVEAQRVKGNPAVYRGVQYDSDDESVGELKEANQALRAQLQELTAAATQHRENQSSKLERSKKEVAGMQRVILMWQVVSWMQASEELRSRRVLYAFRINSVRERHAMKLLRAQQEIEGTHRVLMMWQVVSWMKSSEELRLRRVVVGWRLASARFWGGR